MPPRRRLLQWLGALSATALPLAAPPALAATPYAPAADWPRKPVRLVVTFPPGGASDTVARLLAPLMSRQLGQPVVVDNRPGAGSTLGALAVARSAADGHTLLVSHSAALSISPHLLEQPPYDPVHSFTHLGYIGAVPTVVVARNGLPVHDFAQMLQWLRDQPQPVPYGSGGAASVGHLVGELLARQQDLRLSHVPYRGAGPMRSDLLAGHIPLAVDALPQNLALARQGRLRLLAVTSTRRVPQAPEVPSVVELGLPQLVADNFVGLSAPAGLAEPVARRLEQALQAALADAGVQQTLVAQGFVRQPMDRHGFARLVQQQSQSWAGVARATGATL
ncbi:MAG: tripartite tricarboxylate transporter substrate binding protein [Burkholderiaceae bacterium]|jgi:tripartite-type tricarboxylate transporter receptor subunit TctC|nr:tripartite tricarboxylate transporter substrate binding protein [Burkholderiaceae bacterium]